MLAVGHEAVDRHVTEIDAGKDAAADIAKGDAVGAAVVAAASVAHRCAG